MPPHIRGVHPPWTKPTIAVQLDRQSLKEPGSVPQLIAAPQVAISKKQTEQLKPIEADEWAGDITRPPIRLVPLRSYLKTHMRVLRA